MAFGSGTGVVNAFGAIVSLSPGPIVALGSNSAASFAPGAIVPFGSNFVVPCFPGAIVSFGSGLVEGVGVELATSEVLETSEV